MPVPVFHPLVKICDDPRIKKFLLSHLLGQRLIGFGLLGHLLLHIVQLLGHLEISFKLDVVVLHDIRFWRVLAHWQGWIFIFQHESVICANLKFYLYYLNFICAWSVRCVAASHIQRKTGKFVILGYSASRKITILVILAICLISPENLFIGQVELRYYAVLLIFAAVYIGTLNCFRIEQNDPHLRLFWIYSLYWITILAQIFKILHNLMVKCLFAHFLQTFCVILMQSFQKIIVNDQKQRLTPTLAINDLFFKPPSGEKAKSAFIMVQLVRSVYENSTWGAEETRWRLVHIIIKNNIMDIKLWKLKLHFQV